LQNAANRAKNTILTHQGKKSFAQGRNDRAGFEGVQGPHYVISLRAFKNFINLETALRNEYKVQKGHYEDLIETWRKTHSRPETGDFKTQKNLKNKQRYLDMKAMQEMIKAGIIPFKTDQEILDAGSYRVVAQLLAGAHIVHMEML
ncbi:hypothetical protein Tco_0766376, partial [Tanacetum coccineum]